MYLNEYLIVEIEITCRERDCGALLICFDDLVLALLCDLMCRRLQVDRTYLRQDCNKLACWFCSHKGQGVQAKISQIRIDVALLCRPVGKGCGLKADCVDAREELDCRKLRGRCGVLAVHAHKGRETAGGRGAVGAVDEEE